MQYALIIVHISPAEIFFSHIWADQPPDTMRGQLTFIPANEVQVKVSLRNLKEPAYNVWLGSCRRAIHTDLNGSAESLQHHVH